VNGKVKLLHLLLLMLCACWPMTPVMAAGVEALNGGYIADLDNAGSTAGRVGLTEVEADSPRWDLERIKAPEAWELTHGGKNVLVAVLDTGIDAEHPDLKGKVIAKTSFASSSDVDAIRGHGTHIAGIIAASAGDGGVTGLAYASQLLDVKVAENNGTTDAQKLAQGMIWAVDHGAQILNISIVINQPYPLLEYAAEYAWQKGCIVVAAAGNNASVDLVYPAAYPHVISVAGTDRQDCLARWSNRGSWVALLAPGVDIYSTLPGSRYGLKSGSSYSAALVSGEAALLYAGALDANHDGQVNDEVAAALLNNGDDLEDNSGIRINAYKAVSALTAAADRDINREE
jgi:thermitase